MHMSDALIVPAVAATMYVASSTATAFSVKKVRIENDAKKIPVMGVMAAFVFAAQMINFTIPGTGSSGHFAGGLLLAVLLGPYAGFLAMVSVLAIQALIFADGGILALGCNIWNMAFYACFIGYLFIYRPLTKNRLSNGRIMIGSVLAGIVTLQLGAFSVVLQTYLSGISELSFLQFVAAMQPIHLVIGTMEGLITGAVILFVKNARPELLELDAKNQKMGFLQFLVLCSVMIVMIGGGLSLVASKNPDGLEWSVEKVTGESEVAPNHANEGAVEQAKRLQNFTAFLPDYSFEGKDSKAGTSFSGVFGALLVTGVVSGSLILVRLFRQQNDEPSDSEQDSETL